MKIHKVCICGKIIGTAFVNNGTDIEITSHGICPACGGNPRRGSVIGKLENVDKSKRGW